MFLARMVQPILFVDELLATSRTLENRPVVDTPCMRYQVLKSLQFLFAVLTNILAAAEKSQPTVYASII